tara:strand:- start:364 stop:546 length:183 start_codon:yes stop_codon:yes gene_type:complete
MNDIQIDLMAIREHLDIIEEKLKETRKRPGYTGNYTEFNNTDTNGNYTTEQWNDKIREDR